MEQDEMTPEEKRMWEYLRETRGIQTEDDFRKHYRRFIQNGLRINLAIFTTGGPYDNYGNNRSRAALG